jgi:hypothetical protein
MSVEDRAYEDIEDFVDKLSKKVVTIPEQDKKELVWLVSGLIKAFLLFKCNYDIWADYPGG